MATTIDTSTNALTAEDPKRVIATVALCADGSVAWVDYVDGDYLTQPPIDFSMGQEIDFAESNIKALVGVTTYALLRLRKTDSSTMFCYVHTPYWW